MIPPAPFAVPADLNAVMDQAPHNLLPGELAPLVGVKDLGTAMQRDRHQKRSVNFATISVSLQSGP